MKVIKFLTSFIIIITFSNLFAQSGSIEGELNTFGIYFIKWGNAGENKVILQNDSGFYRETNSESKGKFVFNSIPAGKYSILVDCKAELKDLGLCRMTGKTKVTVKKNKTAKVKIVVHKM